MNNLPKEMNNLLNVNKHHHYTLLNPVSASVLAVLAAINIYYLYLDMITILQYILLNVAAVLIASSIKTAYQWEKAVIFRLGKYTGLKGPGLFFIIPIIERVGSYVDQRVRVDDIKAENTLTKDTVPVYVDAILYWMVWDAEKAVLEVEDYVGSVLYIAQTSLQDIVGRHDLTELLQHRESISEMLRKEMDKFTNPWGITCQAVGLSDVVIPAGLSEALSKQAQAERERQARIILGTAETEIAENFAKASEQYIDNPVALQLRGMNMLYEGLKEKGSLIIVPSSALDSMNLGAIGGIAGMAKAAE